MAHLTIESNNPDFSWVLVKNPESGIQYRPIRQGKGFGWFFPNDDTYNLAFVDGLDCDSFSQSDFEYLSTNKFGNPLAHSSLLNAFLRDVWQNRNPEKDVVAHNSITLHQVITKARKLLEHLSKHLSCDLHIEEAYANCYTLRFSGELTLHELVCNVMVACLFLSGQDGIFLTKVDKAFVSKYADIINKLGMDYYLRYMFARNYFKSKDQFNKFVHMLETEDIKLQHGDTAMQRLRFIEKRLDGQREILDVGCGEGLFALNLPKRIPHTYHAVDIDEELVTILGRKAESRGLDIKTYTNVGQFKSEAPVDVLLVEVIEHMSKSDAIFLIDKVMGTVNFNKIFITTPNRDFNHNYLIKGFRHGDHDWEMDSLEFKDWITHTVLFESDHETLDVEFVDIGDSVGGVHTTQGVIISKKERPKQAVITVGPAASGKSTYAKTLTKKGWIEVNRDDIRFKGGEKDWAKWKFTRQNEERVSNKANKLLEQAIEDGKDIIVSDTNLNKKYRQKLITKLSEAGYYVNVKEFDVDFNELLKRNDNRQGGVPYEVLLDQYIRFQHYKGVEPYKGTKDKVPTVVFDIDGTLAEKGDRSPFDMSKVDLDLPIDYTCTMIDGFINNGWEVVFLSGRNECAREKTEHWLKEVLGYALDLPLGHELFMRADGDNRKDYVIKMELFDNHVREDYDVKAVVDDRKQVIEQCWNVLGIPVVNVGNNLERF